MADIVKNVYDNIATSDSLSRPAPKNISDSLSIAHQPYVDESLTIMTISDSLGVTTQMSDVLQSISVGDSVSMSDDNATSTRDLPSSGSTILMSESATNVVSGSIQSDGSNVQVQTSVTESSIVILSPSNLDVYEQGEQIRFNVQFQKNGVNIPTSYLRWMSNVDGVFAISKNNFDCNLLSVGQHTIKVYAVDEKECAFVNLTVTDANASLRPEDLAITR